MNGSSAPYRLGRRYAAWDVLRFPRHGRAALIHARGKRPGRESPRDLTVFKSVGNAVEDLMVARLALDG